VAAKDSGKRRNLKKIGKTPQVLPRRRCFRWIIPEHFWKESMSAPHSPDAKTLEQLGKDRGFLALNNYVPPLGLLRLIGAQRDEVTHSRILGGLFDPRVHRHAPELTGVLLRYLCKRLGNSNERPLKTIHRLIDEGWHQVLVHREIFRIDVVVQITAPFGGVVVAIENKIDADEQEKQITRYQDLLEAKFPNDPSVLLFLTPTGRKPITARPGSSVTCIEISYREVSNMIQECNRIADLSIP
jgi:hypothetical protein